MRTRSKARYDDALVTPLITGGYTSTYNLFYQEVTDRNNGRLRPESPCDMIKCWTTPASNGVLSKDGTRRYIHFPAFAQARIFRGAAQEVMSTFESRVRAKIIQNDLLLSKRFSAINFLLELREIGTLCKALDKYRYVDYSFGIAPLIDDIKNISDRMTQSISAINSRLDAYSKPIPMSEVMTVHTGGTIPFGAFPNTETYMNFNLTAKCSFKGTIHMELPILSRYNRDYTAWLDQIGFHPDLSAVWEATPFSWLIDWFIPIGDNLEAMSESWLNPTLIFNGSSSCTYTVSSTHDVNYATSISFDDRDSIDGSFVDSSYATGYIRSPLVEYALKPSRKPLVIGFGLDNLHKVALLSDIFGPTKATEDASTFRGRNKRRRNSAILAARKIKRNLANNLGNI